MATQQRKFNITDNDWQIISTYAATANMTPQAWLMNAVVGDWMRAQGHDWDGVKAVGNPNWVRPDEKDNLCHCGVKAHIVENGIICEVCGNPIF